MSNSSGYIPNLGDSSSLPQTSYRAFPQKQMIYTSPSNICKSALFTLNVPRISWGQCQARLSAQKQKLPLLASIPEAHQGSYRAQKKPSLAENLSQEILELEKAVRASRTELALVSKHCQNISETSFNCVYWSSKILNLM